MPFKKGPAAWRRTIEYLKSGTLVFKEKVKVCSINYHETEPESEGLRRFIFWHLAQIQYKNPNVQCLQLKNIVKSPFISFYTLDENDNINSIYVNCYSRTHKEILEQCKKVVGKTAYEIEQEAKINPANFGEGCPRYCICQVEGQIACPRYKPLPEFMRNKFMHYKKEELQEIRKTKSDQQALAEYWNSK
jgi:small subunit ribosomal protein S25